MISFRPVEMSDISWIAAALKQEKVADNTSTIPHPLPDHFVETWISDWNNIASEDKGFRIVGITADKQGFGSAAIKRTAAISGELSFWITPQFWRQGLAVEVAEAIIKMAGAAGFSKLTAGHFHDNLGSSAVLKKLNFSRLERDSEIFSLSRNEIVRTFRYELKLHP
ncbi:GNAT family N-acetyltransferase [Parasphingorhabdus sp.]|uniref:GNAT family N-acetyltransferase n=1 Tax=Parasphingorhabdus sp. TaxID=2709688 RepID=UPI003A90D280